MMLTEKKIAKIGVVLAAAVAFTNAGLEANRLGDAVRGTGSYAAAGVQRTGEFAAWTAVNTVGRVPGVASASRGVSSAASSAWSATANAAGATGSWIKYYIDKPLGYKKPPATKFEQLRTRVAGVLAPVSDRVSKGAVALTDNKVAKAVVEYAYQRPADFIDRHQAGVKRAGIVVAASAAVYGAYYLVSEMHEAERSIALADLEARLSGGDLQDATLATLVETRSIKEREFGAATKRLARRQRAEDRSYATQEENDLLGRLEGELGEIDEALVVAYKADSSLWTRALNVVSHAIAGN